MWVTRVSDGTVSSRCKASCSRATDSFSRSSRFFAAASFCFIRPSSTSESITISNFLSRLGAVDAARPKAWLIVFGIVTPLRPASSRNAATSAWTVASTSEPIDRLFSVAKWSIDNSSRMRVSTMAAFGISCRRALANSSKIFLGRVAFGRVSDFITSEIRPLAFAVLGGFPAAAPSLRTIGPVAGTFPTRASSAAR